MQIYVPCLVDDKDHFYLPFRDENDNKGQEVWRWKSMKRKIANMDPLTWMAGKTLGTKVCSTEQEAADFITSGIVKDEPKTKMLSAAIVVEWELLAIS